MRGGPALNEVLAEFSDAPIHLLVVWEPVIATDIAAPVSSVLELVSDVRAAQFWDPDRTLSRNIVRAVNLDPRRYGFEEALPEDYIVWDVVAVFGPDAQWSDELPVPIYYDGPVYAVKTGLAEALAELAQLPQF